MKVPHKQSDSDAVETPAEDRFEFGTEDQHINAATDLAELRLWPPQQGSRGGTFCIWPELRIAEEVITTDHWRIVVHLTRAEVAARFVGCRVAAGTRYGDDAVEPTVRLTEVEVGKRNVSQVGEGSLSLSVGLLKGIAAKANAKVAGKAQLETKTETKKKSEIIHRRVGTLPNDRWEIREPDFKRLKGSYLVVPEAPTSADEPLCKVVAHGKKIAITLSLEIRPHDIDPEITPTDEARRVIWSRKEKPNKLAIAKLLMTKSCTERFARPGDERVVIALAKLTGVERQPAGQHVAR